MSNKVKLKPCPFCGGRNIELRYGYTCGKPNFHGRAVCLDCSAIKHALIAKDSKEMAYSSAADAWNKRASLAKTNEEVARDEVVLHLSKEEYKRMQEALSEHDRLCEMLSESRKAVGNAAAMCRALEALEDMHNTLKKLQLYTPHINDVSLILAFRDRVCRAKKIVYAALAKPPRNCDVGTAEEQAERFYDHCLSFKQETTCDKCPLVGSKPFCEFAFEQMACSKGDK